MRESARIVPDLALKSSRLADNSRHGGGDARYFGGERNRPMNRFSITLAVATASAAAEDGPVEVAEAPKKRARKTKVG